jgi:hypothetical protein
VASAVAKTILSIVPQVRQLLLRNTLIPPQRTVRTEKVDALSSFESIQPSSVARPTQPDDDSARMPRRCMPR